MDAAMALRRPSVCLQFSYSPVLEEELVAVQEVVLGLMAGGTGTVVLRAGLNKTQETNRLKNRLPRGVGT